MLGFEGRVQMSTDAKYRLSKRIVFDPHFGMDRICWVLDMFCPVCDEPLEVVFDDHPSDLEISEAEQIPCDECLSHMDKDDAMEAIIQELFSPELPERKH